MTSNTLKKLNVDLFKMKMEKTSMRLLASSVLTTGLICSSNASLALSASECVGGGNSPQFLCSAPFVEDWTYGLCYEGGDQTFRRALMCDVMGGTWQGAFDGCEDPIPHDENNLVERSNEWAERQRAEGTVCIADDTGWGITVSSFQCWNGGSISTNGQLTRDFRRINTCGERLIARRDRALVCPTGSQQHTVDGRVVCVKEEDFQKCGVGNPVLPLSGKKIQIEDDITNSRFVDLKRHYSSEPWFIPYNATVIPNERGQFGEFWRTNFAYRLHALDSTFATLAITFPDGGVQYFKSNLEPIVGTSRHGVLTQQSGNFIYEIGKMRLTFEPSGRLIQYREGNGIDLTLKYTGFDTGAVSSVLPDGTPNNSDLPSGLLRVVEYAPNKPLYTFEYDAASRIVIVQGTNESLTYSYNSGGDLIKAARSDNTERNYHYSGHMLTSIIDDAGISFANWTYDGIQANSSSRPNGKENITLDYTAINDPTEPHSTVTNALNKQTKYHYIVINGERKIVKVEGLQSTNCAAANQFYVYYPDGTLQARTDWEGNVTYFQRDTHGRETLRREGYQWASTPQFGVVADVLGSLVPPTNPDNLIETKTCWDTTTSKPERIVTADRVTIYSYDAGRPSSRRIEERSTANEQCQ